MLRGESPAAVIEALGFQRSSIYEWLKQYRRYGEEGLVTKPTPGQPREFYEQLWAGELRDLVPTNPRQLDFNDTP